MEGLSVPPVLRGIVGTAVLPVPVGTEEVSSGMMVGKVSSGADEASVGEFPRVDETVGTEEV